MSIVNHSKSLFHRFVLKAGHERVLLIVGLLLVAMLWLFAELADEIMEGELQTTDDAVLNALRVEGKPTTPIGPQWVTDMFMDFTALGGISNLLLISAIAILFVALRGDRRLALMIAIGITIGLLSNVVLKLFFGRERPMQEYWLVNVSSQSFPSGHAMMTATVYMTLAVLLARQMPKRRLKVLIIVAALFVTLVVGLSRIWLGVHYTTDVLAGWCAGIAWALIWSVVLWTLRRHHVRVSDKEPPPEETA